MKFLLVAVIECMLLALVAGNSYARDLPCLVPIDIPCSLVVEAQFTCPDVNCWYLGGSGGVGGFACALDQADFVVDATFRGMRAANPEEEGFLNWSTTEHPIICLVQAACYCDIIVYIRNNGCASIPPHEPLETFTEAIPDGGPCTGGLNNE